MFFDPAGGSYGKYGGNIFALRMGVPNDRKAMMIEALKKDITANGGNLDMFGGGIVWLYRKLAGMNSDENDTGYRHIIFNPQPAGDVSYVSYSNLTPFGISGITWKNENSKFIMNVNVPVGLHATVYVPASGREDVIENGKKIKKTSDVKFVRMEDDYAVYNIGAGDFSFESKIADAKKETF